MDWNTKPDRYTYLKELLEHCNSHIANQFFPPEFIDTIIKPQKYKCEQELHELKRQDVEMMIMANKRALVLPGMNALDGRMAKTAESEYLTKSGYLKRFIRSEARKLKEQQSTDWTSMYGGRK